MAARADQKTVVSAWRFMVVQPASSLGAVTIRVLLTGERLAQMASSRQATPRESFACSLIWLSS